MCGGGLRAFFCVFSKFFFFALFAFFLFFGFLLLSVLGCVSLSLPMQNATPARRGPPHMSSASPKVLFWQFNFLALFCFYLVIVFRRRSALSFVCLLKCTPTRRGPPYFVIGVA